MQMIIILLVSIVTFMVGVIYASVAGANAKKAVLEGASLAVVFSALAAILTIFIN